MTHQMRRANILLLTAIAVATFVSLDLLKANAGAPFAYAIGAAVAALLIASLLRK